METSLMSLAVFGGVSYLAVNNSQFAALNPDVQLGALVIFAGVLFLAASKLGSRR